MAQLVIGAYGTKDLEVTSAQKLAVRTNGGTATVYQSTGPGINVPSSFVELGQVDGEERVFSFTANKTIRISATSSEVFYEVATDPSAVYWVPPDVSDVHTFFDDFNTFAAGDWTITTTEAGGGSASEALADGVGGRLLITNDAADNDHDFFQLVKEGFKFQSGKRMWFEICFQTNDATETDIVAGLQITDTTPLAVTDGVYFLKSDGAATADFMVTKDSTSTTASAVATLADATDITLGFYYDGASTISYYVDKVRGGTVATTNMPDDEELTVSFGIQNGAAAAKTLNVDYVFAAQER